MEMSLPFGPQFGGARFSPDGVKMAVGLPAQIRFFRAPSLAELDADPHATRHRDRNEPGPATLTRDVPADSNKKDRAVSASVSRPAVSPPFVVSKTASSLR